MWKRNREKEKLKERVEDGEGASASRRDEGHERGELVSTAGHVLGILVLIGYRGLNSPNLPRSNGTDTHTSEENPANGSRLAVHVHDRLAEKDEQTRDEGHLEPSVHPLHVLEILNAYN